MWLGVVRSVLFCTCNHNLQWCYTVLHLIIKSLINSLSVLIWCEKKMWDYCYYNFTKRHLKSWKSFKTVEHRGTLDRVAVLNIGTVYGWMEYMDDTNGHLTNRIYCRRSLNRFVWIFWYDWSTFYDETVFFSWKYDTVRPQILCLKFQNLCKDNSKLSVWLHIAGGKWENIFFLCVLCSFKYIFSFVMA